MFNRRIYLDYASLTPMDGRVLREMKKYSGRAYANLSSWYREGVAAENAVLEARKKTAGFIRAHADEIVFTSGGTEANNIAILGTAEALHRTRVAYGDMHAIQSAVEHSSVRECFAELARRGVQCEEITVNADGAVRTDDLERKLKPNTVIVSVMTVNNETGAIQPIREIAKILKRHRQEFPKDGRVLSSNASAAGGYPVFHTDAAQAGYLDLNVEKYGVELLTLDGSKLYGPRGVGALYVKRNTDVLPIIHGGGQEKGLRSGTENLPGIMGFAKALEIIGAERSGEAARIKTVKEHFIESLKATKPDIVVHGEGAEVSPHIVNVSIPGIDNEFFVLQLDAKGVACSTKSSCLRDLGESYVLKAMNADSKSSVRFSFGRYTGMRDVKKALKTIRLLLAR